MRFGQNLPLDSGFLISNNNHSSECSHLQKASVHNVIQLVATTLQSLRMNVPATLRITASLRTFDKRVAFSCSRLSAIRSSHHPEATSKGELGHVGPQKRQYSFDLKQRGLRSLAKFVDKRKGEDLKPEKFTSNWGSVRRGTQDKFKIENDIPDLPAETQLQTRNRNPRNLELLGYNKPKGYGTVYKRRDFWNRYDCKAFFLSFVSV